MFELDLRDFVQENPLQTANWPELAPPTLLAAQTTWRGRMVMSTFLLRFLPDCCRSLCEQVFPRSGRRRSPT